MNKTKYLVFCSVRHWNSPSWSCWDWHSEAWGNCHLCPGQLEHWGEICGDAPWGPFWSFTRWQCRLQCEECVNKGCAQRICGWWQQKWSSKWSWKLHCPGVYWKGVKIEKKMIPSTEGKLPLLFLALLRFRLSNPFFFFLITAKLCRVYNVQL